MKTITKISLLLVLVMMSSLLISCGQKDNKKVESKTYPNATYTNCYLTLEYPNNWDNYPLDISEPETATTSGSKFISMQELISFEIGTERDVCEEQFDLDDFISKKIEEGEISENDCEDYIFDGIKGYKCKAEKDNEVITEYVAQNKDVIIQLRFSCKTEDYNNYKDIFEQIAKSIKFKNFMSISELKTNWKKYCIDNLVIYYPDDSEQYYQIKEWADTKAKAFKNITEYLGVKWSGDPLEIVVFNSQEHGKEYGLILGFALKSEKKIFEDYTQTAGHELTHCISYWINNGQTINSNLIEEGLATHLDMSGRDYHEKAINILKDKNYTVKLLGEDFDYSRESYELGASFVKYIIDTYGLELFKSFYGQSEYSEEESFKHFYKKEANELLNEWMEYLKAY